MSPLGPDRRGFTLVELLVALVIMGVVTAGIYRALVTNQRTYQAQTQRMDLQQNIRAAITILPAEFRELDAYDGDIIAMAADSIRIRAMRQFAVICDPPVAGLTPPPAAGITNTTVFGAAFTVRNDPAVYSAVQNFQVGDGVLIYYEGDESTRSDDSWVVGQATGVNVPVNCSDGRPGWTVTANLTFDATQYSRVGAIQTGAPVRGFQTVTYGLYQAGDGRWYLGQRNQAGDLQPLVGPVRATDGITFAYFDSTGAVTTDPLQVARVGITVRAETAQPVQGPGGGLVIPVDSISTVVALRNNRRYN